MDVLCEIQKKYASFSEKEKGLADYILQKSDMINNINITELAKIAGTSGATVTRFCKKVGCDSFVDLKIKLGSLKYEDSAKEENDTLTNIYNYYKEVIERTNYLISNNTELFKMIESIKVANKIHIYGVGSSGLTATEMMQRLLRMGFNVHSSTDPHLMRINSALVGEEDLVIGISISGETKEVIDGLRIAKRNKAKIIVVTSFEESSITELSDIKCIVYNSLFVDKERFINTQFATMYLMDLISMVLLKDEDRRNKMTETIKAIVKE